MVPVKHFPDQYRFKMSLDGQDAFLQYRNLPNNAWEYNHTYVPQALRHNGIGEALVKYALDFARENHIKVKVTCPFVSHYLESHPEYNDLLVK